MDRLAAFAKLAQQLTRASANHDWAELGEVDADMAAVLPRILALGPLTQVESRALERLRAAHGAALESCAREAARIDAKLMAMREHREGWMAYALDSDEGVR